MKKETTKQHIKRLENEIEALLIAFVRKVSSHQFYERLMKSHKGTNAGDVFNELAKEENSHKIKIDKKLIDLMGDLKKLKMDEARVNGFTVR